MALALSALTAASAQQPTGVAGGMPPASAGALERLAGVLTQVGMTTCAGHVLRAAKFLISDGEANFVVQPLGPDANRWPTVITIEGAHADTGRTRFSTLTVSPNGQACAGFYEQVITWPQTCAALQGSVFADYKSPQPLLRSVAVSQLNPAVQVHLVPGANGVGCTSVKRELFR